MRKILEEELILSVGFLRPQELGGVGNFYLLGELKAQIEWADGEMLDTFLLGRTKLTEVQGNVKKFLEKKGNLKDFEQIIFKDDIEKLLDEMASGIYKAQAHKKLWGRELKSITICQTKETKTTAGTES